MNNEYLSFPLSPFPFYLLPFLDSFSTPSRLIFDSFSTHPRMRAKCYPKLTQRIPQGYNPIFCTYTPYTIYT